MGKVIDVQAQVKTLQLHASEPETVTGVGTAIDRANLGGRGKLVLDIGVVTGTAPTLVLKVEEADDSGFTANVGDVPGAAFAAKTAAGIHTVGFDMEQRRKVLRANWVLAGTSPDFNFSTHIEAAEAEEAPTNNPAA